MVKENSPGSGENYTNRNPLLSASSPGTPPPEKQTLTRNGGGFVFEALLQATPVGVLSDNGRHLRSLGNRPCQMHGPKKADAPKWGEYVGPFN